MAPPSRSKAMILLMIGSKRKDEILLGGEVEGEKKLLRKREGGGEKRGIERQREIDALEALQRDMWR